MPIFSFSRDEPRAIPVRKLYPPVEAEQLLGISHATLYGLIATGKLTAVKIGSRTAITAESIARLCTEGAP
jgi:excisionase family DNA binding protein